MEGRPGEGVPMGRLGAFRASTLPRPWRDLGNVQRSHSGMLLLLLLRTSRTRRHLWDRHDSLIGFKDEEGQQVSVGVYSINAWLVGNVMCQMLDVSCLDQGNDAA